MFRNYDRKLFAKLEGTGGTAETPGASDFIEVHNPTFTVTPLMFERQPKTMTLTPAPMTVPGTSETAGVSQIEFSFSVELCGPGTDVASGTAPEFDALLQACGLEQVTMYKADVTAGTWAGTDGVIRNREGLDVTTYATAENHALGDHGGYDSEIWCRDDADFSGTSLVTQTGTASCTLASATTTQTGVAYLPSSVYSDDDQTNSSVTIRLYLDKAGTYVEGKGCRGTFDMAFVHGDRVLINFVFTGVYNTYNESGTDITSYAGTGEVPPAFINAGLSLARSGVRADYWTGALFNAMTFTLGNEVAVREDTNDADGMSSAIITGRAPTLTFNPDQTIASANIDLWTQFLSGDLSRLRWSVGSAAGNRVDFRVAAAQFSGITDGERDTVSVLDSTTNLTGGNYGSSYLSNAGTQTSSTFGADNEFVFCFR
jgi:hypothetical protein